MMYILNDRKEIVEVQDPIMWSIFMNDIDARRVGWYEKDDVVISTVFLGLDHGFGGAKRFFETMIFGGEFGDTIRRYKTYKEAILGHTAIVSAIELAMNNSKMNVTEAVKNVCYN